MRYSKFFFNRHSNQGFARGILTMQQGNDLLRYSYQYKPTSFDIPKPFKNAELHFVYIQGLENGKPLKM